MVWLSDTEVSETWTKFVDHRIQTDVSCILRGNVMQLTITIPDDVAAQLQNDGGDIARRILEFVAIQGYRSEELTAYDVQKLLRFESRFEVDAFFKAQGVHRDYTLEDLERERATASAIFRQ
jgi:Uncharacterised protein family (UPF0175)